MNAHAFVIDSGVLATTHDLNLNQAWSKSWVTGESPFADGACHRTHVAGIIGALANGIGVVGVAPRTSILSLKAFGNNGTTTSADIVSAALRAQPSPLLLAILAQTQRQQHLPMRARIPTFLLSPLFTITT
jgi:subtilisin family serine protease